MKSIALESIAKHYGSASSLVRAVDAVSLHIEAGELFFLLGPSGCGKTTLLRMIAGLTSPTTGRVILGDRDVTAEPVEKRNTALVFQNYALWPHMTVRENVEFGPKMRRAGRSARRRRAAQNLARVEMEDLAARRPNQLSGGQQQRVALARALAAEPDCLLLDEPLSNLDARLRLHMRQELRSLVKSTGTTGVYVTHDQKEALSMADRVAVMNAGRVVQIGSPEDVYNRPATRFVADFLGEANFVEGSVLAADPIARVETPLGVLAAPAAGCPPPGSRVCCCVRPERITLRTADEAGGAADRVVLPGAVAACVYLGELRQYVCRLGEEALWKVSVLAGSQEALPPGEAVALCFSAADVALLPVGPAGGRVE